MTKTKSMNKIKPLETARIAMSRPKKMKEDRRKIRRNNKKISCLFEHSIRLNKSYLSDISSLPEVISISDDNIEISSTKVDYNSTVRSTGDSSFSTSTPCKKLNSKTEKMEKEVIPFSINSLEESHIGDYADTLEKSNTEHISRQTSKKRFLHNILVQLVEAGIVTRSSRKMEVKVAESKEDSYIKSVLKKKKPNLYGDNMYSSSMTNIISGLRYVIIDGSNVAMSNTGGEFFSVEGLKICIDYFIQRGHPVKAFVPKFRCRYGKSSNPSLLNYLEKKHLVAYTPSREVAGKFITSYDDRYIVICAAQFKGVIVSNDNYRDLYFENESWRDTLRNRVLPFTWFDNATIIFPEDPLGRYGPSLNVFLRHP